MSLGARPWESEPDHVDFRHAGYSCILHRSPLGAWCGYVAVPKGHPAYGRHYDEVNVSVHGGLTYAGVCQEPICHVGGRDVWWLGFDCAHAGDLWPRRVELVRLVPGFPPPDRGDVYRDMHYVLVETRELAEQLAALVDD